MAFVRFSSLSNVSESGNGTTGWIYTRTGSGDYTTSYAGGSDATLTGDFEVIFVYATGVPNGGLDDNNTADHSGNWDIGCYALTPGANYDFVIAGSFGTPADTAVADTGGDWVRYQRRGSTLTVAVSTDAGGSWTTIRTDTGFGTGTFYPGINFNGAASIGPIYYAANVTFAAAAVTSTATVQQPAVASMQPVAMGGPIALTTTVQQPAITYPITMGGPVALGAVVQQPSLLSNQPVSMGGPVALTTTVQQPAISYPVTLGGPVAATAAVQQPAVASTQPVVMGGAIPLLFTVHPPTVTVDQINALPVAMTLTVPRPAILDPYLHDYPRRSRRERRRSTMG